MVSIHYDESKDIITVSIEGPIANQEIRKYLRILAKDFQKKSRLFVISDYSRGFIKADPGFFLVNINNVQDLFVEYFKQFDLFYNAYVIKPEDKGTRAIIQQFLNNVSHIENFHPAFFEDTAEASKWLAEQQRLDSK